ncbi:MAG: GMC oxidoreductase, partial [Thermoanaerobaculia bacterium]
GERVPVLSSPTMAFALCLPERIGAALAGLGFTLAQLSFNAANDDGAYGNLFSAEGIPVALLAEHLGFTRPGAIGLSRWLQPALLLANCYLPAPQHDNTARLERIADGSSRLVVEGGVTAPELRHRIARLERQLRRAFRKLGAVLVPGSFTLAETGSDLRPAGMLPMAENPMRGQLAANAELWGSPGLYVVDLAGFPALPAKHPTLTMMANADRVGRIIADRWRRARG